MLAAARRSASQVVTDWQPNQKYAGHYWGERKIDCIKSVRAITRWGLKEAKDFVEGNAFFELGLGEHDALKQVDGLAIWLTE